MSRKIIILEKAAVPLAEVAFRFAMWADVPVARQPRYANATATSAVTDASAPELAAIRAGAIVERIEDARWPTGTAIATVQAFLQTRFAAYQAQVTADNPWQRYGTFWDGTTWMAVNNV